MGLRLSGHNRIAQVHQWTKEGRLILEHLLPLSLSPHPVPLKEFMRIATHTTEALAFLHEHDILHNAIHPRRILYSPEDNCYKLTGFGWATMGPSDKPLKVLEEKGL